MTNSPETLDDVIFQFHQAVDEVTPRILKEWTSRYPQFAKEIRSHAVEIAEMELLTTIRAKPAALSVAVPTPTLRAALAEAGTSLRDFADGMDIARSIISDLNAGRIEASSIPRRFASAGADKLGRATDWFLSVVRSSQEVPAAAAFKATTGPTEGRQRSWREAILASDMDNERKAFWLADGEE